MPATVRPALRAEAPIVAELLRRAGFGSTVGRLLDYPFQNETAKVFVAEQRGALVGTASVASFGSTGWIGALGVEPAARRRGLGGALTENCIAWLRERGARTVLLYATEQLSKIEGLRIIGTARDKAAVVSFVMEGIHPHDIGTLLDRQGIAVRTGHHCAQPVMDFFNVPATTRASLALYNTAAEIDTLVAGLHKVKEVFS